MTTQDDDIRKWLELAGPRRTVSDEMTTSVRAVVHDAWRRDLRRSWRRRITIGGMALATAAALFLAVWMRPMPERRGDSPAVVVARLIAMRGIASANGATLSAGDPVAVGASIQIAQGGSATLAVEGGGEWRIDAGSALVVTARRALTLERGAIYVDSGNGGAPAPVVVQTTLGTVEDVGTRFEVRMDDATLRVRVRDGAIRYDGGRSAVVAGAGREIVVAPDRTIVEHAISSYDAAWAWTTLAGLPFRVENQTLAAFLKWVALEGGREVRFVDPALERSIGLVRLHGSVDGLTPEEALSAILPTCGLSHRIADGRVLISRP